MRLNLLLAGGAAIASLVMGPAVTAADMWKCAQADGTVLFSDGGGVGCQEVKALPELQSAGASPVRKPVESQPTVEAAVPASIPKAAVQLSSRPFDSTFRSVPNLYYVQRFSASAAAKGWNAPNKGDVALVHVDVGHWPTGNGPYLGTDHHFKDGSKHAFAVAVLAAAKAVKYDARFLRVELTLPVGSILHIGERVDGPSAGLAQAVAVAAALLGDPLRADVCLSGTIDMNLVVGPVGGLEHKIEGCHMMRNIHEMLLPAGQNTFAITDKGMARSIKVTEVGTLAEAYEIMTGRPLRPVF